VDVEDGVEVEFENGIFLFFRWSGQDDVDAADTGVDQFRGSFGNFFVGRVNVVGYIDGITAGADVGVFSEQHRLVFIGNGVSVEVVIRFQDVEFRFAEFDSFEGGSVADASSWVGIFFGDEFFDVGEAVTADVGGDSLTDRDGFEVDDEKTKFGPFDKFFDEDGVRKSKRVRDSKFHHGWPVRFFGDCNTYTKVRRGRLNNHFFPGRGFGVFQRVFRVVEGLTFRYTETAIGQYDLGHGFVFHGQERNVTVFGCFRGLFDVFRVVIFHELDEIVFSIKHRHFDSAYLGIANNDLGRNFQIFVAG